MAYSQVDIPLGKAKDLLPLFSYSPGVAGKKPAVLKDAIEHSVNQTLLRDLYYGAWAVVSHTQYSTWDDDDSFSVRITSPDRDVTPYAKTLPAFLAAVAQGLQIYTAQQPALATQRAAMIAKYNSQQPPPARQMTDQDLACSFLPPFGLSMVNSDSIQLLHYPPSETATYMDYLYSPTNRRWENLLGCNGYPGKRNTLVETIVDIAPIAAPGGSTGGELIAPILEELRPYALSMLKSLLRISDDGQSTQPIVAYGGPVGEWLQKNFSEELKAQSVDMIRDDDGNPIAPQIGSVFTLPILDPAGPLTPVLCANHPIKFNYYDGDFAKAEKEKQPDATRLADEKTVDQTSGVILAQDLIAAGWQSKMARKWKTNRDPKLFRKVYKKQFQQWGQASSPKFQELLQVFREQVLEFALNNMPEVDTDAWMNQLQAALGTSGDPATS